MDLNEKDTGASAGAPNVAAKTARSLDEGTPFRVMVDLFEKCSNISKHAKRRVREIFLSLVPRTQRPLSLVCYARVDAI